MHDGQGLFKPNPFSRQPWKVDETVDRLISGKKIEEIIVVGIESNKNDRANEFSHKVTEDSLSVYGAPEITCRGELYEDFVLNQVKPYIDSHFRTLSDSDNTAMLGSSMGGLVTYNISFRHPEIIGKAAIISPYFIKLDLNTLKESDNCRYYNSKGPKKIWLDVGDFEANIMPRHVLKMLEHLHKIGYEPEKELMFYCIPGAAHTENQWAKRLYSPLIYLFGDKGLKQSVTLCGRNVVGKGGMSVFINPVIKYDSGLTASGTAGDYIVLSQDILKVDKRGEIKPKSVGSTVVIYNSDNVNATREYTVIDQLPEYVSVSVKINVPENTPENAVVTLGKIITHKIQDWVYGGIFTLPRDIGVQCNITCTVNGAAYTEKDKNGNFTDYRRFKADKDLKLEYTVEKWSD